jgi:hypothetical protein
VNGHGSSCPTARAVAARQPRHEIELGRPSVSYIDRIQRNAAAGERHVLAGDLLRDRIVLADQEIQMRPRELPPHLVGTSVAQ